MAIKILASADLHLGKRSSGISAFGEDCSTKLTWKRMVEYAVRNAVDVVLLAGDVIDRNNRYYEASGSLQEGFRRLKDAGIEVFMVSGNHDFDVLPQVLRNHPFDNVHLLGAGGKWEALKFERNGKTIQFIGWSFREQYVHLNPILELGSLQSDPNCLRIGLLHADVGNMESRYAPVPLLDLQNANMDIWILGHIHKPWTYEGIKTIRYPGSPQSLSAKETGSHGALLLTVDDLGRVDTTEVGFSNCRFERLSIDISSVTTEESLRGTMEIGLSTHANEQFAELEGLVYLVYDLHLTGQHTKGHDIENWAGPIKESFDLTLTTGAKVFVRSVTASIRPAVDNIDLLAQESSPAGLIAQTVLAIRNGTTNPFLDELVREWELHSKALANSAVFQPLHEEWKRNGNPRTAQHFIQEQCNRLLTELLYPTN